MAKKDNHMQNKVLVIGGPTGVGESTVTQEVIKNYSIFKRLVTATTRKPRLNEEDGVDYYFFSKQKFMRELKAGNIVEYTYVENRDVYYGSYKPDLEAKLKQGYNLIINPDLVGAKYYKKNYNALTIFIMPDSLSNLRERLVYRDPNLNSDELAKRLSSAQHEIEHEAGFYDYQIVNKQGELEITIDKVLKIVARHFNVGS